MTNFKTVVKLPRLILMLTAGVLMLATADDALAKNGGSNHSDRNDHVTNSSSNRKADSGDKDKDRHKDKDKYSDKDKHKDKDKDKYSDKDKDKDKDKYADKDKCKNAAPGTCGTNTIHPIINPDPKPVASNPPPAANSDPVVRDHRPGGNAAGPVPGTIIRDHRNGADGKPVVVVSSSGGVTVTRPATDADLQKAGLLPKPAPSPVTVPIGAQGGGR